MPKICLNPGHFIGIDPGAVGKNSTEAELVMEYAKLIKPMLEKVGYEVTIVNYNELYDIVNASDQFGADLLVSIHCNSAGSSSAFGTETYYYIESSKGKKLAECIQNQVEPVMRKYRLENYNYPHPLPVGVERSVIEKSNRGIKTDSLYVVRNTNAIASLVEVGFISSELDENILINKKEEISAAIARGITDYFI